MLRPIFIVSVMSFRRIRLIWTLSNGAPAVMLQSGEWSPECSANVSEYARFFVRKTRTANCSITFFVLASFFILFFENHTNIYSFYWFLIKCGPQKDPKRAPWGPRKTKEFRDPHFASKGPPWGAPQTSLLGAEHVIITVVLRLVRFSMHRVPLSISITKC